MPALPGEGPRLQDILVDGPLEITLHDGFEFWLDDDAGDDPNVKASLERANASIYPTVRLAAARAAYWCRVPDKGHVRWVLPDDEDAALDALARLAGARRAAARRRAPSSPACSARTVGWCPVWDIPGEPGGRRVGGAAGATSPSGTPTRSPTPPRSTAPPAAPSRASSAGS